MTSDLYIDGAMLARVRSNFGHIRDLLGRPAAEMRQLDARHLGPDPLVSRAHQFADDWHYGIDQLGKFSQSVVEALNSIEKAFDQVDADLAKALRDAGKGR